MLCAANRPRVVTLVVVPLEFKRPSQSRYCEDSWQCQVWEYYRGRSQTKKKAGPA